LSFFKELKRRNVFKVAAAYIIIGWLIMQAGEVMGPALRLPEWVDSLLAFFLILGFPLAMFFAWAFELTPEGLKLEHRVDGAQSTETLVEPESQEKGNTSDTTPSEASIAVLPFVNLSSDSEQEYFSDGISEELLNLLAKVSGMYVTARTSSFQFKGRNLNISEVGKVLGVSHVLEGSVRKSGDRVRITAQLIEVATGFHKWSETYDRTLHDIFAIQDEISAAIVGALKELILGEVETPTSTRSISTEAYEKYLIGQQSITKRTQESIEQARECFEKSLALDPCFLPSMTGLADALLLLSDDDICYGDVPLPESLALALPILDRALAQNPDSEEVHTSFSFYYHLSGDTNKAQFHAEKAIAISQNCSRAYRILGLILKRSGNPRALVVQTREKALHLSPASPIELNNLFSELPVRSRYSEAAALLDRIEVVEHGSVFNDWGRFSIAWNRGNLKEGLAIYAASNKLQQDRQWSSGLQLVLTLFGFGATAEELDLPSAFKIYCEYGYREDARRLWKALSGGTTADRIHVPEITLSLWHVQEGRYKEADLILRSIEQAQSDQWGILFDIDEYCLGARLAWFVREQLGDQKGCQYYEQKLKEVYSARLLDHEGVHKATHYIGACVANMDGERETAINELKQHVARFPGSSIKIFFDPLLQDMAEEPTFENIKHEAMDHIASEKQAAFDSGLLPPSNDLISRS
jgi:TolB-like protein